jgi:hypothetical protein
MLITCTPRPSPRITPVQYLKLSLPFPVALRLRTPNPSSFLNLLSTRHSQLNLITATCSWKLPSFSPPSPPLPSPPQASPSSHAPTQMATPPARSPSNRSPLRAFLPLSEAATTRRQKPPGLIQDRTGAGSFYERRPSLHWSVRQSVESGVDVGVDVERVGEESGRVWAAWGGPRAEALITPQMRSMRLIGNSNPRYRW